MHLVTRLPDLLLSVFGNLDSHNLTICSRVCYNWLHISTGLIWRTIGWEVWVRLLRMLAGVYTDDSMELEVTHYRTRFSLYASKIQDLDLVITNKSVQRQDISIHQRMLDLLASPKHTSAEPLFPRLRSLKLALTPALGTRELTLFSNQPSLSHVDITLSNPLCEPELAQLDLAQHEAQASGAAFQTSPTLGMQMGALRRLLQTGNRLLSISLRMPSDYRLRESEYTKQYSLQLSALLADHLYAFSKLESFELLPYLIMTPRLFATLSSLPRLKTLAFERYCPFNEDNLELSTTPFRRLEELKLGSQFNGVEREMIGLIESTPELSFCTLNSLIMSFESTLYLQQTIKHAFKCEVSLIDTLSIKGCGVDEIPFDCIRPVCNLRHLRHLSISQRFSFSFTDEDISVLAMALPELRTLALRPNHRSLPKPKLCSLSSIKHLVDNCCHISSITLSFSACTTPPITNRNTPHHLENGCLSSSAKQGRSQPLTTLTIWPINSAITDVVAVSTWLRMCCRRYSSVKIAGMKPREYANKWVEVRDLLRGMEQA